MYLTLTLDNNYMNKYISLFAASLFFNLYLCVYLVLAWFSFCGKQPLFQFVQERFLSSRSAI